MQIGNTFINVQALASENITEAGFKKRLRGKLDTDLSAAWALYQREAKKLEKETIKEVKPKKVKEKEGE